MALKFPVAVTMPNGEVHRPAKVHTHDGQVDIYVWRGGRAHLVAEVPGPLEPAGFRQWQIAVEAPEPIRVADTGGCGCGHPLHRWVPTRPVRA